MILEAIVTTINEDGSANVSPMGPTVNENTEARETFELRPFDTSRTFANLKRTKMGVLHVTDDVELFARAAIGQPDPLPEFQDAVEVTGQVIANACRWYEFQVDFIDESGPRMSLNCRTVHAHRNRDFWGFNRGKHAVLEAAILATRLDFLPAEEIREQFIRLQSAVNKTGGQAELDAFGLLCDFVGHENGNPASA
jgi:hypothetical protein